MPRHSMMMCRFLLETMTTKPNQCMACIVKTNLLIKVVGPMPLSKKQSHFTVRYLLTLWTWTRETSYRCMPSTRNEDYICWSNWRSLKTKNGTKSNNLLRLTVIFIQLLLLQHSVQITHFKIISKCQLLHQNQ